MAMPEMDDLLDQLEEEVEKERRLKQKEQAKESGLSDSISIINANKSLDGLLIPSTSTSEPIRAESTVEEPSFNHTEEIASSSKIVSQNGQTIEKERINGSPAADANVERVEESSLTQDEEPTSTSNDNLPAESELLKEVSVDVLLSFERPETLNSPALKILNDENRLVDTATISETSTDNQQNAQPDNDLISPIDTSIDNTLKDDTQIEPTRKSKTELIEPTADLQEAIKAMPQEDGLDFETIANQQNDLSNQPTSQSEPDSTSNNLTDLPKSVKTSDAVSEENSSGPEMQLSNEPTEVKEVIELSKSTELSGSVNFTQHVEEKEVAVLSLEAPQQPEPIKEKLDEELTNEMPDQIYVETNEQSAAEEDVKIEAQQTPVTAAEVAIKEEEPKPVNVEEEPKAIEKDVSENAFEMAKSLLEEIGDVQQIVALAKEAKKATEEKRKMEEKTKVEEVEDQPGTSQADATDHTNEEPKHVEEPTPEPLIKEQRKSVILSTHAVGNNVGNDLRLTESELQLGKVKPIWIKDEDCKKCMLCTAKFTLVNRRHHCRCCGRVLCSECCNIRRSLPYMQQDEKKQRVCGPCNSTLDRIEIYEKAQESAVADQPSSSSSTEPQAVQPTGSFFVRKKSVLKNRTKSENEATQTDQSLAQSTPSTNSDSRRSVKFLDGVAPGDELSPNSQQAEEERRQSGIFSSRSNRSSRSSSRRTREAVAREENVRLNAQYFYCCNDWTNSGVLKPWKPAELFKRLEENLPVRLILKRNIHAILQFIEYQEKKVFVLYTAGFNTLGVDELLIVFEKKPTERDGYLPENLVRSLMRYSEICLSPTTNMLDDRNGIRQCANRLSPLFELDPDESEGHDAVAIYFHPYQNQDLNNIAHPTNGAFRIGIFVQEPELPLVKAMPSRFLHRLGMLSSVYPVPVLNEIGRPPVFEPFKTTNEIASATILSMFYDFRNNSYQLPRIAGSYALICESGTEICLPIWSQDQMKRMTEANSNLLAWALELSYQADSLFSCERIGNTFSTRIFMRSNTRDVIGAAFVAFATGHKGAENGFTQTVVEDGLVIRLSSDGVENLLKRLASGDNFRLQTESGYLQVKWLESEELTSYGSINSPIDGLDLRGYVRDEICFEKF